MGSSSHDLGAEFRMHSFTVNCDTFFSLGTYVLIKIKTYVLDEGSLLPKYRDCTTSNDFELYLMCCGVMLLLLIIYTYIYIYCTVIFHICMSLFESTLLSFCKPQSKLDLPTLR